MNRIAFWMGVMVLALPLASLAQTAPAAAMSSAQDISLDPAASGVRAVNDADELLTAQSPDAAISFFTDVLSQTRNAAVQRAIRFHLVELYKKTGRPDKALEVLKDVIVSTPPLAPPTVVQVLPAEPAVSTSAAQTPQQ